MGTDISTILEVRKEDGLWYEPSSYKVPGFDFEDPYLRGYYSFPFNYRSYSLFGFLGNVRNTSCCPSITDHRGFPEGSVWLEKDTGRDMWGPETNKQSLANDGNDYGFSWVTLQELLDFDYSQQFEDLRLSQTYKSPENTIVCHNGNVQGKPGDGQWTTVREHLGEDFFTQLEALKTFGKPEDVRVFFYFN